MSNFHCPNLTMGEKLKMFREIRELSQEELAKAFSLSAKTISAWENGEREITLSNANLICAFFNIPDTFFVFNKDYDEINNEIQEKISDYLQKNESKRKIQLLLSMCKNKLISDGLPVKKEYLPSINLENLDATTYGLFDEELLPIKITKSTKALPGESTFREKPSSISFEQDVEKQTDYAYKASELAKYGLYDVLYRFNESSVELKDLTNCNDLTVFKTALKNTSNNSTQTIQLQLNNLLENLNPHLPNFWNIIVFLIDNGAFYTKQVGYGSDVVVWNDLKDVSKTNLVYRHAKDTLSN